MAYTIITSSVAWTDSGDAATLAGGVRTVTGQITDRWRNNSAPFDEYDAPRPGISSSWGVTPGRSLNSVVVYSHLRYLDRATITGSYAWGSPAVFLIEGMGRAEITANNVTPNSTTYSSRKIQITASIGAPRSSSFQFDETTLYSASNYPNDISSSLILYTTVSIYNVQAMKGISALRTNYVSATTTEYIYVTGSNTPPAISNIVPSTGSAIYSTSSIRFDVTDDNNSFAEIVLLASFPSGLYEVVFDGNTFANPYVSQSMSASIAGGLRFTLLRNPGWEQSPSLKVIVVDRSGSRNV